MLSLLNCMIVAPHQQLRGPCMTCHAQPPYCSALSSPMHAQHRAWRCVLPGQLSPASSCGSKGPTAAWYLALPLWRHPQVGRSTQQQCALQQKTVSIASLETLRSRRAPNKGLRLRWAHGCCLFLCPSLLRHMSSTHTQPHPRPQSKRHLLPAAVASSVCSPSRALPSPRASAGPRPGGL